MRTLQFALVAALFLALGCRSNNSQVLVEQEARMLEDEVYHLEAQLDACCRAKEALKNENEDLQRQSADGRSPAGDYRAPAGELPSRGTTPSRRDVPKLEPPTIELPESSDTPPAEMTPGDEQPAVEGQPSSLSINRRLTGGLDRDGAGGDEGIMVMIEPRNQRGELVKTPGAVSVVVMDPAQSGDAARVARWDFQAHEFDDHFTSSTFGRGLKYELDWPGEPPQNRDLVLFVRYIAGDGTKLTTDAPLSVRMASDSPREPRSRLRTRDASDPGELSASDDEDDAPGRPRRSAISPRQARDGRPAWSPFR
jgi:hypothetical protein